MNSTCRTRSLCLNYKHLMHIAQHVEVLKLLGYSGVAYDQILFKTMFSFKKKLGCRLSQLINHSR